MIRLCFVLFCFPSIQLHSTPVQSTLMSRCAPGSKTRGGGGPLVFEVGYHPCKKIRVIRVVFQDQTMYARTSFRGAKRCKIGKKGVFLVIVTNFGKDMMDKLRKTHAKTRI